MGFLRIREIANKLYLILFQLILCRAFPVFLCRDCLVNVLWYFQIYQKRISSTDRVDSIIAICVGWRFFCHYLNVRVKHEPILHRDSQHFQFLKEFVLQYLHTNLGYFLELKDLVDQKIIGNEIQYISKSTKDKKIIPNFLIDKNDNIENLDVLLSGLKIVSNYLEKTILNPNHMKQPVSRLNFINTLKWLS